MTGRAALPVLLVVAACAHGEPAGSNSPDPLGPAGAELPRRLTFNPGDDRAPAWAGTEVAYSRYDPARGTSAQCLAALPIEGGTLRAIWCPPFPTPSDTFVSTWLEPALSDDGSMVAFVWQRGAQVSALAAWSHHLVVAAVDSPAVPRLAIFLADTVPGGNFYNTAYELGWAGPNRLRFVAAYDSIFKVKGGGADRFTDTLLLSLGLLELDVGSGTVRQVPGGGSVTAYTPAPDGALWVIRADTLWRLDDAGNGAPLLAVGQDVSDVAAVDGRVVVARRSPAPESDTRVTWWDLATGAAGTVAMPGPVHRISAAEGRRFVAEVEADGRLFGAPANLWLFELPPGSAP